MRRATRIVLQLYYYYAQFIGILRYHYDHRAGRVYTQRFLSLYSVAANLVLLSSIPLIWAAGKRHSFNLRSLNLHEIVTVTILVIRAAAVIVSVAINWLRQEEFIAVTQEFHHVSRKYFSEWPMKLANDAKFERDILLKFTFCFSSDASVLLLFLASFWAQMNWVDMVAVIGFIVLTNSLNIVMNLYYYGVVCVNLHMRKLNNHLNEILNQAMCMPQRHSPLASNAVDMEEISQIYRQLFNIAIRINRMYTLQGSCCCTNVYLNNMGFMYLAYTFVMNDLHTVVPLRIVLLLLCALATFYIDLMLFFGAMLETLTLSKDVSEILAYFGSVYRGNDKNLEKRVQYFQLQIAENPFEYNMLGLFKFNPQMGYATFVSTVTHSILLIQYDYQHD